LKQALVLAHRSIHRQARLQERFSIFFSFPLFWFEQKVPQVRAGQIHVRAEPFQDLRPLQKIATDFLIRRLNLPQRADPVKLR
jgi:hypothetical protein